MMHRVYMDGNATTPLLPEVFEAMRPYFLEQFGNASSVHRYGQHARAAVERAREQMATLLGCRPAEIVFTSGGTEGDNFAIFGAVGAASTGGTSRRSHVITSAIEHHAVLNAVKHLASRGVETRVETTIVPVDGQGLVDPADVRAALRPHTRLISIMAANNETGVIEPLAEIGAIAAEAGVLFHTDAVQAAGKIPLHASALGCHLLSISGHKMHAPQGTGALYIRRGTLIEPMFFGGNHERQRRAGTENLAGIVGLGVAAQIAHEGFSSGAIERMTAMRDRLEQGILARVPGSAVNSGEAPRVPNTTSIRFDHVEGEPLTIALDLKGLAVSSGAACSSGAIEPSHVLLAMGLSPEHARGSVRFSLGKLNIPADVDFALSVVPEAIARLRALSPLHQKLSAEQAVAQEAGAR